MKSFFKTLWSYFLQGLLFVAPIGLTIYILVFTFVFIDDITSVWTEKVFGIYIPGLGFLLLLILITLVGWAGKSVIAGPIRHYFDSIFSHIPILKSLYIPIKDVVSAFMGKEKKFTNPVLVKVSNEMEIYRIGFITQTNLSELDMDETMISVFIPYSYAIMGNLLIVPLRNISPLKMSSADALKFAISGGLTELVKKEKKADKNNGEDTSNINNQ